MTFESMQPLPCVLIINKAIAAQELYFHVYIWTNKQDWVLATLTHLQIQTYLDYNSPQLQNRPSWVPIDSNLFLDQQRATVIRNGFFCLWLTKRLSALVRSSPLYATPHLCYLRARLQQCTLSQATLDGHQEALWLFTFWSVRLRTYYTCAPHWLINNSHLEFHPEVVIYKAVNALESIRWEPAFLSIPHYYLCVCKDWVSCLPHGGDHGRAGSSLW